MRITKVTKEQDYQIILSTSELGLLRKQITRLDFTIENSPELHEFWNKLIQ